MSNLFDEFNGLRQALLCACLLCCVSLQRVSSANTNAVPERFDDDFVRAQAFSDSKREALAAKYFTKVIEKKHNLLNAYVMRAHCYMIRGKFKDAIGDCTDALKINPQCQWALHQRARCYWHLHRYEDSLADSQKCIEIDPQDDKAFQQLVSVYTAQKRPDLVKQTRVSAPGHKRNLYPYMKHAKYFEDKDKFDQAVKEYSKIIALFPHDAQSYWSRAKCYVALKMTDKAIDDLTVGLNQRTVPITSCCSNDPMTIEMLRLRAKAFVSQKNYERAKQDFNTLLLIDPGSDEDYLGRADAEMHLGDAQSAIEDYTTLIMVRPKDEDAYRDRARAFYSIGEYRKAIADYSSSIQLEPEVVESFEERGKAYEKLGDSKKAKADADKAEQLRNESIEKK